MATRGWNLQGRTVLITGAARGIGAESARRLTARGARVSLVGLEPEELERVAGECGPDATWFEADVTDWDALEAAVSGTLERFGGIDAVVANAGVAPVGPVRSIEPAAFERTIEINLLGVWRTVRACLPHVIERRGYVLPIASIAAAMHAPGMAAYSTAKAGVEAFADCLRAEVAHLGVDVGCGYFSFIATDMVAGGRSHPATEFLNAEARGPFGKTYPLSAAGEAVAQGVESRSRAVVVPGWARLLLRFRIAIRPLAERQYRNHARQLDESFEADVAQRGRAEASAPVGAGGAAVRDSVVNRT
jgi:NAD(P)-dependent dehydrogenase (short-subunit alcohol dehydrogenase family)